jgi:single-strand DNA-binding protein
MSGVNKVILVGRLGADPEVKQTNGGGSVCNFSVATSERFKGKDGEQQEKTEWHKIVVFGRLADICGEHLRKGKQVFVEGRLQSRSWDDEKTGAKKYVTEIVAQSVQFLGDSKRDDAQPQAQQQPQHLRLAKR